MRFAADTSAILSLACSRYFGKVIELNEITITPKVLEELGDFALYDDFLGRKAQEAINLTNAKKINVFRQKLHSLNGMQGAEAEVFSLAVMRKIVIVTDDIHAARIALEKHRLSSKPSLYILVDLWKKKRITRDELIEDINNIAKRRSWMGGVLWQHFVEMLKRI